MPCQWHERCGRTGAESVCCIPVGPSDENSRRSVYVGAFRKRMNASTDVYSHKVKVTNPKATAADASPALNPAGSTAQRYHY